ncbi:xylulokinase [Leifsonia naganoensis]|uniref:Xylulose kinase n=1 Tax=Leifsonia naganoensis TaxID=150025 RepID=A0A853DN65_9MICO|nr:xylulokinase [Leifsonia naganoensis]NYK09053.1 xylulokinase [Leifsonia naganoensis]
MTARRIVAGVDSSTQSCKVELFDAESGVRQGGGSAPHPPVFPPVSEQRPEDWWTAFVTAFHLAVEDADVDPADVIAISVAAQCHGLVPLDSENRVIRPAKLWNDTTSTPELARLRGIVGDDELVHRVGTVPTAAFTIGKVAWLAEHEPTSFERLDRILLPHDYLTFRLTGRAVTDRSEASGTGYYDADAREYLPDLLRLIDPHRDWLRMLPEVLAPSESAGEVIGQAREELELPPGVLVGAGGGDQHAAALGLGIVDGDVVYSFGTSGVVSALSPTPIRDVSGHVDGVADMTGGYMPLVSTLNAARTTDTFARILNVDHHELSRLALDAQPGPVLAPYLDGERTPDLPGAVGILGGITTSTSREQVARAAYEGVVLGLVSGQNHLERMGVRTHGRVLAVGGGAKSPAYQQLLADAVGRTIHTADVQEATARGAAVQAAAIAHTTDVATIRDRWAPRLTSVAQPRGFDESRWEAYRAVTSIRELDRP